MGGGAHGSPPAEADGSYAFQTNVIDRPGSVIGLRIVKRLEDL